MREILFRGKRIDNGEWVYGFYAQELQGQHYILADEGDFYDGPMLTMVEVIPETVGQYTGHDDKNGVKVFDGDVLVIDDDRFLIQWEEERGGFRIDYWQFDEQYDLSEFWPASEVIGNIHDNPEVKE